VPISLAGHAAPITVRVPVIYRYADPVRGAVQRPVITAPAISVTLNHDVELARAGVPFTRALEVTVRSSLARPCTLTVHVTVPAGMTVDTPSTRVTLAPGATRVVTFTVSGALAAGIHDVRVDAREGGHEGGREDTADYTNGFIPIEYEHITPERMYRPAVVHMRSVDVALAPGLAIGYVQGVGDNVAPALEELGIPVTMLDPADFPSTDLSKFPVIVVGTRAYQANHTLVENNHFLLDYVKRGGHLVVQYGQYEMQQPGMMPYPITLARPAARVTEEDAAVRITDPASRFLTTPNRISSRDFDGWVQERSVYMPTTYDARYATALTMHDTGEPDNAAAILSTPYGNGRYTYVTLALFRQVPAGVPGGIRLFANLLTPARP
jgi:hypothetical protein